MQTREVLQYIKNRIDQFLEKIAQAETSRWEIGEKIDLLESIVFGKNRKYWRLDSRFACVEKWFLNQEKDFKEGFLTFEQLERILVCVEKLKDYKAKLNLVQNSDSRKKSEYADQVLKLANRFVLDNLNKLGLGYTPLGIVRIGQAEGKLVTDKGDLRNFVQSTEDVKGEYRDSLKYQKEMLEYFYTPDEHLLSILDFQLKNLESTHSPEDEFFVASILYFLKQHNYKITPFFERFKRIVSKSQKTVQEKIKDRDPSSKPILEKTEKS